MITASNWRKYIDKLAAIDKKAADLVQAYINEHGLQDTEALIQYAYAVVTKYGETSATLASEMYDHMADLMNADVPEAIPAETASLKEVAKGVTWGKYHSPSQISSVIGRQVRQAGADTMIQNARRDNAQWAWIPQGDTCAFCITLASRGWQDASKAVLKGNHAEHIHQNCDCTFAIAFKSADKKQYDSIYDPKKYEEMYYGAEGNTPAEKTSSLRRRIYAKKRDEINAQKRDAYQARNLMNQGEINAQQSNNSAEKSVLSMKRKTHTEWGGKPMLHTENQISELNEFAKNHNVILDSSFRSFDGDIGLVEDFIRTVDNNINVGSHVRNKYVRLAVSYSMHDEVYAETNGAMIIINGYAYRDRGLLMEDYQARVSERWFTQGSTYQDIATHESGHMLVYLNQLRNSKVRETIFGKDRLKSDLIILERISEYATKNNAELIAESYVAYKNGSSDEYVLKVMNYCGILK